MLQEFLIEELAKRAFDITARSNRDIISYSDVGECMMHSTILLLILLSSTACCIFAVLMLASSCSCGSVRVACGNVPPGYALCSIWYHQHIHHKDHKTSSQGVFCNVSTFAVLAATLAVRALPSC